MADPGMKQSREEEGQVSFSILDTDLYSQSTILFTSLNRRYNHTQD